MPEFRHVRSVLSAARGWFTVSVAAWTAFAVLITVWTDATLLYLGHHVDVASSLFNALVQMYTLGLLTPVFIYVAQVFPPTRRPVLLTLGVYIATLTGVCIVGLPMFVYVSNHFLGKHFTIGTVLEEFFFTVLTYAIVLTIVVAVTQVRIANERLARALRLEADLSRLRVEALQRQLHPHFIFNTLNAVGAIMHTDVAAAEEMIAALADLLRSATDKSDRPIVPLREELTLLDRYAIIMKLRYGDRLNVSISAEPRALQTCVPTFMLQPLVENAIVHGLEKTPTGITVEISCRLDGDTLCIDVNDDGLALDMATFQEGVGIGNTRSRLLELYGQKASLSITPREARGTRLTLAVPATEAMT